MLYNLYSPSMQMYLSRFAHLGDMDFCVRAKDAKMVFTNLEVAKHHLDPLFYHHLDSFHDLAIMVRETHNDTPKPLGYDILPNREEVYFDHQLLKIVDCTSLRADLEEFNIMWTIEDRVTFNNLIRRGDLLVTFRSNINWIRYSLEQLHAAGELTGDLSSTKFINKIVDLSFPEIMENWHLATHRMANVCIVRPENQLVFKLGMHMECTTFMVTREPKKIFA